MNKKRIAALVATGIIVISAVGITVQRNNRSAYGLNEEDDKKVMFEHFNAETSRSYEYMMDQELVPVHTDGDDKQISKTSERQEITIISGEEARQIALAQVEGSVSDDIHKFEIDDRNEYDAKYEIDIIYNGHKYELEINAYTGKVTTFEREASHQFDPINAASSITREKAIEIALAQVPGATLAHVEEAQLDEDDGRLEWDIEIRIGAYEYEIDIDAHNGDLLTFEIED